jgi:hypothetical protein
MLTVNTGKLREANSECIVTDEGRRPETCSRKYFTFSLSMREVALTEINTIESATKRGAKIQYL